MVAVLYQSECTAQRFDHNTWRSAKVFFVQHIQDFDLNQSIDHNLTCAVEFCINEVVSRYGT